MKEERKRTRLNWKQACARLGCGKTKLYLMVESGEITAYRVGLRGMWFYEEDIAALILKPSENG